MEVGVAFASEVVDSPGTPNPHFLLSPITLVIKEFHEVRTSGCEPKGA
jgi:hypothetical protein